MEVRCGVEGSEVEEGGGGHICTLGITQKIVGTALYTKSEAPTSSFPKPSLQRLDPDPSPFPSAPIPYSFNVDMNHCEGNPTT